MIWRAKFSTAGGQEHEASPVHWISPKFVVYWRDLRANQCCMSHHLSSCVTRKLWHMVDLIRNRSWTETSWWWIYSKRWCVLYTAVETTSRFLLTISSVMVHYVREWTHSALHWNTTTPWWYWLSTAVGVRRTLGFQALLKWKILCHGGSLACFFTLTTYLHKHSEVSRTWSLKPVYSDNQFSSQMTFINVINVYYRYTVNSYLLLCAL